MTKKKGKLSRKSRKKGSQEDVKSSTSLPPAVEGPLRCFLRVAVTKVTWTTPKLPDATHVRLKWWGEISNGTLFRPVDGKNQGKADSQTVARFPIRCGPKQFSAYLSDMGSVSLDVLRGASMILAGRAQINEISILSPQKPVTGLFPVFSVRDSQKIAEVQINMMFEPLITSYDSSSSLPTTDASVIAPSRPNDQESVRSKTSQRSTSSHDTSRSGSRRRKTFPGSSSTEGPFTSATSKVLSDGASRDVESDYSFVIGQAPQPIRWEDKPAGKTPGHGKHTDISSDTDRKPLSTISSLTNVQPLPGPGPLPAQLGTSAPAGRLNSDLISALLDRGKRLRDAMIKEELGHHSAGKKPAVRTYSHRGSDTRVRVRRKSSTGDLFREILQGASNEIPVRDGDPVIALGNQDADEMVEDAEGRAVELLVGDVLSAGELRHLKALQVGNSPAASLSSHSDGDDFSEDEDPLHDNSILEQLFYKGVGSSSESLGDLLDSDSSAETASTKISSKNVEKPNLRKSMKHSKRERHKRLQKEQTSPGSNAYLDPNEREDTSRRIEGRIGKEMSEEEEEEERDTSAQSFSESRTSSSAVTSPRDRSHSGRPDSHSTDPASGLSVQRLTLLGRVHVARVTVDKLVLQASPASRIPVRVASLGARGKPPRPEAKKKMTFFVEYQFPVSQAPRPGGGASVGTMATELMRVVSKKVSSNGKEVTFGHRSVFPVQFDGQAVDRWWKQLLVFKVFSKMAGDKHPAILGVASIPLRSLIQSPDLVTVSELPVRDKASPSRSSDARSDRQKGSAMGVISVSMELASDSKDFASALAKTRVAEMKGARIVPLPSDQGAGLGTLSGQRQAQQPPLSTTAPSSSLTPSPREGAGQPVRKEIRDGMHSGADLNAMPEAAGHGVDVCASTEQPNQQVKQGLSSERTMPSRPDDYEALTLHSLLYIKEGQFIPTMPQGGPWAPTPHPHPNLYQAAAGRDRVVHNTYLVGRLFWSDDAARSDVCWGTTHPSYDFVQVSPVLLTQSLLERTRNNFTVIEVWDKKTSAQHDQLLGIAKLPLHQLYMSYRDQRIAKTLLKSQYPVVTVDSEIPITDPFTGQRCGQLTVLLALGSQHQVLELQRLKSIRHVSMTSGPERPVHYAERLHVQSDDVPTPDNGTVEHTFEVVVECIQGLPQLEDSVWGEADCFIQYHFPHQSQQQHHPYPHEDSLMLRPHRTSTTLCVPDPAFNDVCRHRLVLAKGTPVQRELLTACAGGGGHAGGIPFEVWCRFYYPNVRDQVVAKATLPLAKLCAMVTMQRRGEPSIQTFSLPLRSHCTDQERATDDSAAKLQTGGLLDVTVSYKQAVVRQAPLPPNTYGAEGRLASSGGPHVSLALTLIRACGLKAAAKALARYDNGMQYPSQVGVNSYVKIQLSFMTKGEVRVTRTIARSFSPEYNHHIELPCPLLLAPGEGEGGAEGDAVSLAEALETADLILQIWHQVPGLKSGSSDGPHYVEDALLRGEGERRGVMAHRVVADTGDKLLGTATIPLVKLLASRTGIEGWFPINLPPLGWDNHTTTTHPDTPQDTSQDTSPHTHPHPRLLDRVAGGVELSVRLGQQGADRERVIHAGRKVGWSPDALVLEDLEEVWDGEGRDDLLSGSLSCEVTMEIDSAWFPVQSSLRPGQSQLDPHTKAYIRYKFYDKGAVCSKLCYLDLSEGTQMSADLKHSQTVHIKQSQPFTWYLREEAFEVQLWLSYGSEPPRQPQARPRQRDKLIGCAYLDLSPLGHRRSKRHRVSGLFPLYKPGCPDMGGACIRAHVSLRVAPQQGPSAPIQDEAESAPAEETSGESKEPMIHTDTGVEECREEEEQKEERQKNRPVWMTVIVEKAMHLSNIIDPARIESHPPSPYVTFQSAVGPSPAVSPTVAETNGPQWMFTRDVAITPHLLDNQSLIFKVWHQVSSKQDSTCDRVLGFSSVDLGPLLAGIRSLDGWYNIMDFSGQTLGQIKISITPKESLSPLRHSPKQRTLLGSPNTSHLFSRAPVPPPHHILPTVGGSALAGDDDSLRSSHPAVRSLDHFQQHLDGVREFHSRLQERLRSLHRMETGEDTSEEREPSHDPSPVELPQSGPHAQTFEPTPSSSYLVENLRKNMKELDVLQQHLKSKLSGGSGTSALPPLSSCAQSGANTSHHHGNQGRDADHRRLESDGGGASERECETSAAHQGGVGRTLAEGGAFTEENENNNRHQHPHHRHGSEEERRGRTGHRTHGVGNETWDEMKREYVPSGMPGGDDYLVDREISTGGFGLSEGMRGKEWDGEEGEEGEEEEVEETGSDVVYVRPLNDVSSAAFSNGINDAVISPPFTPPTGLASASQPDSNHYHDSASWPTSHQDTRQLSGGLVSDDSKDDGRYYPHRTGIHEVGMDSSKISALGHHHSVMDSVTPKHENEHENNQEGYYDNSDRSQLREVHRRNDEEEMLSSHEGRTSLHSDVDGLEDDLSEDVHRALEVSSGGSLGSHLWSDAANSEARGSSGSGRSIGSQESDRSLESSTAQPRQDATKPIPPRGYGTVTAPQGYRTEDLQERATATEHEIGSTRSDEGSADGGEERDAQGGNDGEYVEDGIMLTLDTREAELQQRQLGIEEEERLAALAAATTKAPSKSASSTLPDFFLPPTDLEASMRALYNTVSGLQGTSSRHELSAREQEKFAAAQEMARRLTPGGQPPRTLPPSSSSSSSSTRPAALPFSFKTPTADEAKRIAKIFSAKF